MRVDGELRQALLTVGERTGHSVGRTPSSGANRGDCEWEEYTLRRGEGQGPPWLQGRRPGPRVVGVAFAQRALGARRRAALERRPAGSRGGSGMEHHLSGSARSGRRKRVGGYRDPTKARPARGRHAEPAGRSSPAGRAAGRRRVAARSEILAHARAPRVPAAGRPARKSTRCCRFYNDRPQGRDFERGHPARARTPAGRPGLPVPHRARSRRRCARTAVSHQRSRARLAAVVLPLEQHSRR